MTEDELCLDAEHLTTETAEGAIAAGVGGATQTMVRAVHFDDEAEGWGEEVDDGVAEDDLAAEGDAETGKGETRAADAITVRPCQSVFRAVVCPAVPHDTLADGRAALRGTRASEWLRGVMAVGVVAAFVACGSSDRRREHGDDSPGGEGGEAPLGGGGGRGGSGARTSGGGSGALGGDAGDGNEQAGQAGTSGMPGTGGTTVTDPCEGIDCSGNGVCVASDATARCDCEPGFAPRGLECVACAPLSGTYDIDVPMVALSGNLSVNGDPVAPLGDALLRFVREDGDAVTVAHLNAAAYSVTLVPGTYDIVYELQTPDAAIPANLMDIVREDVTIDASGTFDIDVPMVTVSGALSVNGQAVNPFGAAQLLFRRQGSEVATPGASFSFADYSVVLLPGTYDVFYASVTSDDALPHNRFALVLEGVRIETDRTLDVDVPMVTLSGDVSINGQATTTATETRLFLRNAAGDEADLGSVNDRPYSAGIVPGTYDVFYAGVGESGVVPANGSAKLGEDVEIAGSLRLDLDVPMVTVTGNVTVSGQPITPSNVGLLYFAQGTEDSVLVATTQRRTFSSSIVPGRYDVVFVAQSFGDDGLPDNQYALLQRNVTFDEARAFDIDIPVAVVSGELTVNGEPPSRDVAATFFFRTAEGDTVIAATLDAPTYRAEFVPGTYDVYYSGQIWGNAIPANRVAPVLSGVNVEANTTLHLEVPAGVRLSGAVTVNGAPAPASGSAVITLAREPNDTPELAPVVSASDYETLIVPGTYDVFYEMRSPGSDIPANVHARLGCVHVE